MAVQDTGTGAKMKAYTQAGPASYATGGFLLDASADFSWLGYVAVQVITRGVLPIVDYEILLNRSLAGAEAFGQANIKLMRGRYDKASMGAVSSLPSGVTAQSALFAAASTTGSSHTHTANHDHPVVTSAVETASGALGVNLAASGGNMRNHTHNFDVPAYTGSTDAATHAHNIATEYTHSHGTTVATTDVALVEMAAGTNLSGVTFVLVAVGFGEA